jgi:predicted RNA methylase
MLYIAIIGFLFFLSLFYAGSSLAPLAYTRKKDLKRINTIANLKPGQTFVEMGAGTGRVCSYVAKHNPSTIAIGIELAWPLYIFTKYKTVLAGPSNLQIQYGNALHFNYKNIDVIYTYALVKTLKNKVQQKLLKEMKPDATFISYIFSIKNWPGDSKTYKKSPEETSIHVYTI